MLVKTFPLIMLRGPIFFLQRPIIERIIVESVTLLSYFKLQATALITHYIGSLL